VQSTVDAAAAETECPRITVAIERIVTTGAGKPRDVTEENRLPDGRGGEIRTRDPYNPIVVRYQAALRPDRGKTGLTRTLPARDAEVYVSPSKIGLGG
jgi:hypothetical protein